MNLTDGFKRIIVVKDVVKPHFDDDGILVVGLQDFFDANGMERLSEVWAFPAGAGRAVAVSRIKFPEPAEGVIRVRSASALCNRRVRTLRASIPNAKRAN